MKKIVCIVLVGLILLCGSSCLLVEGCCEFIRTTSRESTSRKLAEFERSFENDGVYKYYYNDYYDAYSVVGLVNETENNVLYIPSHFKGKPILEVGYEYQLGMFSKKWYSITGIQEAVYYPYTLQDNMNNCKVLAKRSFKIPSVYLFSSGEGATFSTILFERKEGYEKWIGYPEKYYNIRYYSDYTKTTAIPNTIYLFNYEEAPNGNYFFINDFERGGLIEDTPYEPIREGYVFIGWYKEPECINKWDFEKDTLPEPEYKEDGELIFVETTLYAGWEEIK